MALAIFALMVSLATGWAVLLGLWPGSRVAVSGFVLRLALAGGLGLFVNSVSYLACLGMGIGGRTWVTLVDLFVLMAAAAVARRRTRSDLAGDEGNRDLAASKPVAPRDWILAVGLGSALLVNAGAWLVRFGDRPLGFWDAFSIWNLKARFFFAESGEHWLRAFSDTISWSHTDYPLFLPLSVARLWTYAGGETQAVPALLAVSMTLLIGALLFGAVSAIRGRAMGILAAFALLATPAFMDQVVWQLADIPMSYFLATSLALVVASRGEDEASNARSLVLAGVSAGTAAWTKNEGLLFALAIVLGLIFAELAQDVRANRGTWIRLRRGSLFGMGLAPPLVVLVAMKLMLGGTNDLAADLAVDSLSRIFELARHQQIMASFARTLLILTGVPLLVSILGLGLWAALGSQRGKREVEVRSLVPAIIAVVLQLSGYYVVYLMTGRDLAWHLDTSNLRLFVQLWPSVLLLVFIALPPLDDDPVGEGEMEPVTVSGEAGGPGRRSGWNVPPGR